MRAARATSRSCAAARRANATRVRASVMPPPTTCAAAADEARAVLRTIRASSVESRTPRRVRVELPLPRADARADDDAVAYLGLHGQAADWSGGLSQRLRATKRLIENNMLDGYDDVEYLGLLDRDADGMGVWKVSSSMTCVTHPSDTTMSFFVKLARGDYGKTVTDPSHVLVVVNAFWSGNGERVGQPWEFQLKKDAKALLSESSWEKVYSCRRMRSAAGVEGTLVRRYPGRWMLFNADGSHVVREWNDEPSNRDIAESLNEDAGRQEAVGWNRDAANTSRDDDVIT